MRTFCMVSTLMVFTLACAESGPVAHRGRRRIIYEESVEAKKKPSAAPTTVTTEKEVARRERILPPKSQPSTAATGKQESAEPGSAATQKLLRELIAIVEEEKTAATKEEEAAEDAVILEITGLIMEETMTKIGYDFYEYFFLFWEAPQGISVEDYNILISEKASPMWGSWVTVSVDETVVWSRSLRPRSEEIEDAVKEAIGATLQYLHNYEQYQFQSEDFVGTGI